MIILKIRLKSAGTDGTYILNKSSKPVIRALKTDFTKDIYEKGSMNMGDLAKIKDLYFGGDMNAAPALAGQSSGLINEVKSVKNIIDETISEYNRSLLKAFKESFLNTYFLHIILSFSYCKAHI